MAEPLTESELTDLEWHGQHNRNIESTWTYGELKRFVTEIRRLRAQVVADAERIRVLQDQVAGHCELEEKPNDEQ